MNRTVFAVVIGGPGMNFALCRRPSIILDLQGIHSDLVETERAPWGTCTLWHRGSYDVDDGWDRWLDWHYSSYLLTSTTDSSRLSRCFEPDLSGTCHAMTFPTATSAAITDNKVPIQKSQLYSCLSGIRRQSSWWGIQGRTFAYQMLFCPKCINGKINRNLWKSITNYAYGLRKTGKDPRKLKKCMENLYAKSCILERFTSTCLHWNQTLVTRQI